MQEAHPGIKRCSCGHLPAWISPTGIYGGLNDPKLVAYQCVKCGSDRGLKWADATPEMRREAQLAEMARLAIEGAI